MEQPKDPVVIVGSARTPIGDLLGTISSLRAQDLGAFAIKAAISRAKLCPENFEGVDISKGKGINSVEDIVNIKNVEDIANINNIKSIKNIEDIKDIQNTNTIHNIKDIDEVIMGCVLSAGLGQAPARQASLLAGIPSSVPCSTINKVCGSGMKAVINAHDSLLLGRNKIVVAGGMESMSNAPYLQEKARSGYRLGHKILQDAIFTDGLEDAYEKGISMGVFAERTAEHYQFSRVEQDDFARISLERARESIKNNWFLSEYEICPVLVKNQNADSVLIQEDEHPMRVNPEKIPKLKPSFKENGTITPANSSAISDGAAALILMRLSEAKIRGLKPIAKILGHSSFSNDPAWFTTAPVFAIHALLESLNWTPKTPDLYEINEAFACVPLAAMRDLNLPVEKVNVLGGACALGHPIGASGARIICTLLSALQQHQRSLGIASLCIGGGEAMAIAIEYCHS